MEPRRNARPTGSMGSAGGGNGGQPSAPTLLNEAVQECTAYGFDRLNGWIFGFPAEILRPFGLTQRALFEQDENHPPHDVGTPLRDSSLKLLHSGDLQNSLLRISPVKPPHFGDLRTFPLENATRIPSNNRQQPHRNSRAIRSGPRGCAGPPRGRARGAVHPQARRGCT